MDPRDFVQNRVDGRKDKGGCNKDGERRGACQEKRTESVGNPYKRHQIQKRLVLCLCKRDLISKLFSSSLCDCKSPLQGSLLTWETWSTCKNLLK